MLLSHALCGRYAGDTIEVAVLRPEGEGRATEPRERALVHLACSGAVRAAVEAVGLLYDAVGTRANFEGHPLERRLRDVRIVPQHLTVSSPWLETAGGVLLGLGKELPFG